MSQIAGVTSVPGRQGEAVGDELLGEPAAGERHTGRSRSDSEIVARR